MLLGSDLLIFANESDTVSSLRLHDVEAEITTQTCLDYWLDNIMNDVAATAICYHKEGIVQGYQVSLRTKASLLCCVHLVVVKLLHDTQPFICGWVGVVIPQLVKTEELPQLSAPPQFEVRSLIVRTANI